MDLCSFGLLRSILDSSPLMMGEIYCPETSERNYPTRCVTTQKSAVLTKFAEDLKSCCPSHKFDNYLILGRNFLSLLKAPCVLCYYPSYHNCFNLQIIFKTVTANTLHQRWKQTKIFRRYISLTYHNLCRCRIYEIIGNENSFDAVCRMQDCCLEIFHNITFPDIPNLWIWYTTIRVWWTYPTIEAAFS